MRLVLGVVLAAVLMFLFAGFYWMILPPRIGIVHKLADNDPVLAALAVAKPDTGVYLHPWPYPEIQNLSIEEGEKLVEQFKKQHLDGPIVQVMVQRQGAGPETALFGILHMLVTAGFVGLLTRSACSGCGFGCRWMFIVSIGVVAAVWIDGSTVIWFHYPWDYQLFVAGYHVGAWVLAGVPLAWGAHQAPV